jgi:site-specific DNA-methyltransferase (adenine-specific)
MALMARYPDKYFELAIVDPPYGINVNMNMGVRKGEKRKHSQKKWDTNAPDKEYFQELFRVSKNQIIWGANNFIDNLSNKTGWVFWDKLITGNVPFSAGELAWTSFDCALKKASVSIQNNYIEETRIHPTQKPVALYKWLLHNYAKQGDKILDTHLGSGSIAIACHDYGFDLTACELDKEYFDAAMKRIQNHTAQGTLF